MVARTTSITTQPTTEADQPRKFLGLSLAQLLAGAGAAVTSAFAASRVGVGGTLLGAAFGSIISSVAAAAYAHSLTTASKRIRRVPVLVRPSDGTAQRPTDVPGRLPHPGEEMLAGYEPLDGDRADGADRPNEVTDAGRRRAFGWRAGIALAVSAFVAAIAIITVLELGLGRPVSGQDGSDQRGGTSVGEILGGDTAKQQAPEPRTTPAPSVTDIPTPSASEPEPTPSSEVTDGPTASASEPAATPTQSATPTTPTSAPTTSAPEAPAP